MSNPHPLAYLTALFLAGAYTVAAIAGYLTAVKVTAAVVRWRRRPRPRGGPVARLMALHDSEEAAATRAFSSCHRCQTGDVRFKCRCGERDCYATVCNGGYRPLDPDPAIGCRFCGPPFDAQADCGCASACKDPNCGWNAWPAAAMTEEWNQ